eukprot:jgi/Tetstr1/454085/TSEL_041004.t1
MVSVADATLNVAAGTMMAVLLVTRVSGDWKRFAIMSYAALFVVLFFIPAGGQVNVALAMGLGAYALLGMVGTDRDLPGAYVEQREKVKVFEGIMTAKSNIGRTYSTYDPTSTSYKRLPRSINRMGGAQFTYSFWMMFERGVSDSHVAGKSILLRGDKRHYQPRVSTENDPSTPDANYFERGMDYTIACPRISFVTANQLAVDVNTDRELRTRFLVGSEETTTEMRKNALSLIPGHFALFTFVFEDNVGTDSFERGIRMKFYLNDRLYHTATSPGALRLNTGPLHLFLDAEPAGNEGLDHCKVADLTYFNYALEDRDVAAAYGRGFTNKESRDMDSIFSKDTRLHMGARNRLDFGANYDDRMHTYPSCRT